MFSNNPQINARNISATSIHNVLDLNVDKPTFEGELSGGDYTQIQGMAEVIINVADFISNESNYIEGVQGVRLNARSHTAITENETTKTWYGKKKTVIQTSTVINESLGDAIHTTSTDGTVVQQNKSMHLHVDIPITNDNISARNISATSITQTQSTNYINAELSADGNIYLHNQDHTMDLVELDGANISSRTLDMDTNNLVILDKQDTSKTKTESLSLNSSGQFSVYEGRGHEKVTNQNSGIYVVDGINTDGHKVHAGETYMEGGKIITAVIYGAQGTYNESLGYAIHTSSADGTVVRQNESMHLHVDIPITNDNINARSRGLEGLLANSMFPINPGIHQRNRPEAIDEDALRQRGRQQPQI